eukprot:189659-Pleurochrysis_carterae.AAC.1
MTVEKTPRSVYSAYQSARSAAEILRLSNGSDSIGGGDGDGSGGGDGDGGGDEDGGYGGDGGSGEMDVSSRPGLRPRNSRARETVE